MRFGFHRQAGLRIRAQLEMEGQIIEDEEQESTGRHEPPGGDPYPRE